jgi:hypothetical protein
MEGTPSTLRRRHSFTRRPQIETSTLLAWLLPLALVTYLGMRGGGYDQIVSGEVAIAAWWLIFLLVALRLGSLRTSPAGRLWLGLLFAYAAWTTLSLFWTVSAENTMIDVSLMVLYCGVALLAMVIPGPGAARHMLNALGVAIVAIGVLALLSRLRFEWFAPPQTAEFLQSSAPRLSYPLNYWNALGALMAIGVLVLLHSATGARSIAGRGLAAAAIPLLGLCGFLTASRGAAIAVAVGLVVFVLLAPQRFPKLAVLAIAGAGAALLLEAANQRAALRNGLRTPLALHQGGVLLVIAIVVAIVVGLLVAAIALAERRLTFSRLIIPSRRQTTLISAGALVVVLVVFAAAGGSGFLSREWTQFKNPAHPANFGSANTVQRLQDVSGEGRYQYWQSAVKAADAKPLTGTGAGTFVYWWAQHGVASGGYVRDAHSLYIQSLAELGYPGLILIVAVIATILLGGAIRVVRGRDPTQRLAIAAATAAATVFAVSASIDWIWLIPVLPVTLVILAAVIFAPPPSDAAPTPTAAAPSPGDPAAARRLRAPSLALAARIAGALAALIVIVAVALPIAATSAVRQSQSLAAQGKLAAALEKALDAAQLQPYAATPRLQEALVLEQAGDLADALTAASAATAREPTNWQPWFVRSRLEARTDHPNAAIRDYNRARSLDPRNPLFSS